MRGRGARASGGTAPGVGRPAGPRLPPVVQRAGRRGTPAFQRLGRGGAARARRANLRARLPSGPVPDPARVRAQAVQRAGGGGPHSGSARAQAARCLRDSAGCLVPPRPSGRGGAGCPGPQCLSRPAPQRPSGGRRRLPSASAARRLGGSAERLCSAAPVRWSGVAEGAGAAAPAGLFPGSVSPSRARRRGPRIPQRPPLGRGPRPGRRPGSVRRGREWPGAHAQVPCDQGREGSPGHIQGGPEPAAR